MLSDTRARRGRVIFDTFRSARDPRLSAWLLFRSALVPELEGTQIASSGGRTTAAPVGVYGVWRLLATNNRELARCALVYVSPGAALDAVRLEQGRVLDMAVTTVRGPRATTHGWVIRRGDRPVVTAARWYESAGEAAAAARAATVVLATADIAGSVSIGTASGRRSTIAARPQ